ncbi:MAG: hypothetical protein JW882_14470 [Deltaproteobacteria bacterium]|nr:hypothetical protein [Deltaproteobacteria bacterium]
MHENSTMWSQATVFRENVELYADIVKLYFRVKKSSANQLMNTKSRSNKAKTARKKKPNNRMCITCLRPCSMSGLCMKPWPKSSVTDKDNMKKRKGQQK